MNILFYENGINPLRGGVERVSYTIAKLLRQHGICSYACYLINEPETTTAQNVFKKILYLPTQINESKDSFTSFLKNNNISVIINQKAEKDTVSFLRATTANTDIRIYTFLHTSPTASRDVLHMRDWRFPVHTLRSIAKELLYHIYQFDQINQKLVYKGSDKIVLLSPQFVSDFCLNVQCKDQSKIFVIPNIATYSLQETSTVDLKQKKKLIISVSRMGETHKRVSQTLDLWGQVMNLLPDWRFILIGDGPDLPLYKKIALKNKLKNIQFVGYDDPYKYYQEASVFLSASATEGFGMTTIEAQQMGVVPIVMDNYKVLHDLIENGINGCITKKNDLEDFTSTLLTICKNDALRHQLAQRAMISSQSFLPEHIIPYWLKLLKQDNE